MNLVVHIPHASQSIPLTVREQFVLSDAELAAELLIMTDAHTDLLFHALVPQAKEIVFPVSRLVVDPERFRDDDVEPMSRVGMGVVYTRTAAGKRLRRDLSDANRVALIEKFYDPHHAALTSAVDQALADTGGCLILDCHSFPSVPLPYEIDQDLLRPDICLGVDRQHTPDNLVESLKSWFDATKLQTSIDRPFAGTIVPEKHYGKGRRVWSIMIEVNRRLYMDEQTGRRLERFDQMRELLRAAARSERFRKILDN